MLVIVSLGVSCTNPSRHTQLLVACNRDIDYTPLQLAVVEGRPRLVPGIEITRLSFIYSG
jgi:hypothetical protein